MIPEGLLPLVNASGLLHHQVWLLHTLQNCRLCVCFLVRDAALLGARSLYAARLQASYAVRIMRKDHEECPVDLRWFATGVSAQRKGQKLCRALHTLQIIHLGCASTSNVDFLLQTHLQCLAQDAASAMIACCWSCGNAASKGSIWPGYCARSFPKVRATSERVACGSFGIAAATPNARTTAGTCAAMLATTCSPAATAYAGNRHQHVFDHHTSS
jgi:hypothetical protein